ncbi:MAG: pantetheine-phosphate adenylyltransferase [Bacillota bacterium]|nr:pantetheine-phosphate adenylyltransferase [Bacillota bacterium]
MKIAVYAGTFDPITEGHLDIASRASHLFDRVIFAVAEDNYKNTLFNITERCSLAREAVADYPNIIVEPFAGLLVDYCHRVGATSIIRGLRAVSDFDRELQMALMNRSLNGGVDTVFLMSDARFLYISSSLIKNTAQYGGDVEKMVPACVFRALQQRFPALSLRKDAFCEK